MLFGYLPRKLGVSKVHGRPIVTRPSERIKEKAFALQRCNVGCGTARGCRCKGSPCGIGKYHCFVIVALEKCTADDSVADEIVGFCGVGCGDVFIAERFTDGCARFIDTCKPCLVARRFGVDISQRIRG